MISEGWRHCPESLTEFDELGLASHVLLATGDVSTDGTREALENARNFIESEDIYNEGIIVATGLGARFDKRLIAPGNHDRYNAWIPYQGRSEALEDVFGTRRDYPYVVGYRRPEAAQDVTEPALIFFVFDSTASPSQELVDSDAPWRRIARGRIENDVCDRLVEQKCRIVEEGSISDLDGNPMRVNYDNAVRIVVLHHHPVNDLRSKKWTNYWTLLENSERFTQACYEAGIDIVLFGHDHEAGKGLVAAKASAGWQVPENAHKIWFFCCPSVSEYSERRNGFYRFDFETDSFFVEEYIWNGKSFIFGDAEECNYKRRISMNPRSDAARS